MINMGKIDNIYPYGYNASITLRGSIRIEEDACRFNLKSTISMFLWRIQKS